MQFLLGSLQNSGHCCQVNNIPVNNRWQWLGIYPAIAFSNLPPMKIIIITLSLIATLESLTAMTFITLYALLSDARCTIVDRKLKWFLQRNVINKSWISSYKKMDINNFIYQNINCGTLGFVFLMLTYFDLYFRSILLNLIK